MKRLFVAIPVSDEIKRAIKPIAESLASTGADPRLVPPENIHFTLKFLGDVDEKKIPEIENKLLHLAKNTKKFILKVKNAGVFPSLEKINVVWLGVEDTSSALLMKKLNQELNYLKPSGYEEEIPHLTIARIKTGKNKAELQKFLKSIENREFGQMEADRIILYESELLPEGPVHTVVKEFRFGKGI